MAYIYEKNMYANNGFSPKMIININTITLPSHL